MTIDEKVTKNKFRKVIVNLNQGEVYSATPSHEDHILNAIEGEGDLFYKSYNKEFRPNTRYIKSLPIVNETYVIRATSPMKVEISVRKPMYPDFIKKNLKY
jgi:hypothetical protein